MVTALLPTDGGQRKRKDIDELEGKPAKRKSVGNEDNVPGGVDDVAATALQKLQLVKDPTAVQQKTVPGTTSGLVPTTEHPLSDTRASDPISEQASNTEYQPAGRANCI